MGIKGIYIYIIGFMSAYYIIIYCIIGFIIMGKNSSLVCKFVASAGLLPCLAFFSASRISLGTLI